MKVADCTLERARELAAQAPALARRILEEAQQEGTHPATLGLACALALSMLTRANGARKESMLEMIEEAWALAGAIDEHARRMEQAS